MVSLAPRLLFPLPLCALLGWLASSGPALGALKVGDSWPDFGRFQLEGKLPEKLRGQVLLVDFWASWCAPCKASFPVLEALHQEQGARGLVVIGVNVDEKPSAMEAFLKKAAVTFCVVRDGNQKLVAEVDVSTMPASFLVDRAGKVRFVHTGFRGEATRKQYQAEIELLLSEPVP